MIRTATPADIPTILSLIHQLAEYERASSEVKATQAQLHSALFGSDAVASTLLACDEAGEIVGFALWFRTFSTWLGTASIYLEDLFVVPDARGAGFGRALLTELAAIAVERGYGRVEWSVLNWNEPAHGFYRKLGARPQDDWTVWRLTGGPLQELATARQ